MRYAQLSGTDFFVFVRGLVYFNIACTSRCAPVWDADISKINMKKKLANPYTAVNGVEPTRVFPAGLAPLAFVCPFIKKVKVSHSLIAVWAVGVRVPLYIGHS